MWKWMARTMKDSGVEWIGQIPKEWGVVPVKRKYKNAKEIVGAREPDFQRLALTMNGIVKRPKESADGLQPEKFNTYQIIYNQELLFKLIDLENVRTSRVGRSQFTGIVSPVYIRLINPQESSYGFYFFTNLWHQEVFNYLGSGVRSSLNATDLLKMPYLYVPEEEQRKIVEFLDEKTTHIDDIIVKTKESIEAFKEYKQALITETVTKGLNPDVKMKDSGIEWIGETPEHWYCSKMKYITNLSRGQFSHRPRNDERYYNGVYPFIQTGDVAKASKFITSYSQTLNELGKSVSKEFPKGTLVMTIAANVGDVAVLDFDSYFPDSVIGFVPKDGYYWNYLYYLFTAMKPSFVNTAIVSTQLNLNIERVKEMPVPITTDSREQQRIAAFLDDKTTHIDSLIANKEKMVQELEAYKKAMIYEYVTGKKEVD